MARYSSFLGASVEVQYRAGDILLPASGTFVGDTGRSIFLEQNFEQRGQPRQFRWEIPYQYIVRLAKKDTGTVAADSKLVAASSSPGAVPVAEPAAAKVSAAATNDTRESGTNEEPERAITAAAGLSGNVTLVFPRPQTAE